MPFFEGVSGRVFYRRWQPPSTDAVIVFLHGYGEHTGFYHRLGYALNQYAIELYALDEIGHGLSEGASGVINSIDDLVENGRRLTDVVRHDLPSTPLFLMGHSMGAAAAAVLLIEDRSRFEGAILTGSLLSPVEWIQQLVDDGDDGDDALFELDPSLLSSDPLYLDEMDNDLLPFDARAGTRSLARVFPQAWARLEPYFATVETPLLFVQGELDVLGPVATARSWAKRMPRAEIVVYPERHHDILNEVVHAEVVNDIVTFVREQL